MRACLSLVFGLLGVVSSARADPVGVGNFVWRDRDRDGLQDAGEPGMSGIIVQLWNSAKSDLIDSATTTASGTYQLTAPGPGNYRVRVLLPSQLAEFSPKDLGASDLLDSDINPDGANAGFTDVYVFPSSLASISTIDAGISIPEPVDIGDFVWEDIDRDGVQDPGEPGVPGMVVQLWNDARNNVLDQTTTDAAGGYVLLAPDAGSYRVRVVLGATGFTFTAKDQGGNDARDSDINPGGIAPGFTDTLAFAAGVTSTTSVDAGVLTPRLFSDGFE